MTRICANCGQEFKATHGNFCGARECRNELQRRYYRKRHGSAPPTPCCNCGKPTGVGGPKTERRWCLNPDCQRAKWRWRYHQRQSGLDAGRVEDRPCSRCGVSLPKRPWREDDHPAGRWCKQKMCQDDRRVTLRQYESDHRYWYAELEILTCPECGLDRSVRKGYWHPLFAGPGRPTRKCLAVGDRDPDGFLGQFATQEWTDYEKARAV